MRAITTIGALTLLLAVPTLPEGSPPAFGGQAAPSNTSWEKWWELNRWSYLGVTPTGGGDLSSREEQAAARTKLTKWLIERLSHEHAGIRSAAALALGKAGDKTASEALVKRIGDENRDVRESAVLALGLLKDPAIIPTLVREVFENPKFENEPRLHAAAAIALGFIGDKSATPVIVKELRRAKDDETQYGCIAGLGLLQDESGVEPLFTILGNQDLDKFLRAHAASALGKCGIKEFKPTGSDKPRSVVDELVKRLLSDTEVEVRQSAVLALGALGAEDQFQTVCNATEDKNRVVRNFAIVTLPRLTKGEKPRGIALKRLTDLLGGRNHEARGFAAVALGRLGEPSAAGALRKAFASESDPSIRAACAVGLGLLKDKDSIPMLEGVIGASSDVRLRGHCCVAVGLLGVPAGAKQLKSVVKNTTPADLLVAAAVALASLGDRDAIPMLLEALKGDSSGSSRQSTVRALACFRDTGIARAMQEIYDDAQTGDDIRAIVVACLGCVVDRFPRPLFQQLAIDFNYGLPGEMTGQVLKLF